MVRPTRNLNYLDVRLLFGFHPFPFHNVKIEANFLGELRYAYVGSESKTTALPVTPAEDFAR